MEKRYLQIAGYDVTQLSETEYEAENKEQGLDFHFDTSNPAAVEVFAFDSTLPTDGEQDPCVAAFYAENLQDAVIRAMSLQRASLERRGRHYNVVLRLRDIANRLESELNAETKTVLFPGWHEGYEGEYEPLIREAASAILASALDPDEGTEVSYKAVAALIHYIADMME
jgi:hypothetical protein